MAFINKQIHLKTSKEILGLASLYTYDTITDIINYANFAEDASNAFIDAFELL